MSHEITYIQTSSVCGACKGFCCSRCVETHGYFRRNYGLGGEIPAELKPLFDDKTGFKGEHGCRIPVEQRSEICREFICTVVRQRNRGEVTLQQAVEHVKSFIKPLDWQEAHFTPQSPWGRHPDGHYDDYHQSEP